MLLVEAVVEVKRVLLVFYVGTVILDFGLLVVLRLQVLLQEGPRFHVAPHLMFSISVLINLGQTLVLVVEVFRRLPLFLGQQDGLNPLILGRLCVFLLEYVLDGPVFEWKGLVLVGRAVCESYFFDGGEEVEFFGTHVLALFGNALPHAIYYLIEEPSDRHTILSLIVPHSRV